MDLLSFDFILDKQSKIWLCEVNGCPYGLQNTFAIPNFGQRITGSKSLEPLAIVAEALAISAKANDGVVALPLDETAAFPDEVETDQSDILLSLAASQSQVVNERIKLAHLVRHAGVDVVLCGSINMMKHNNFIYADNAKIGVVYSNYILEGLDIEDSKTSVCTQTITRQNCRDKLKTNKILEQSGLEDLVIPSSSIVDAPKVQEIIEIAKRLSGWLVLKPRGGFGSFGLTRLKMDTATMYKDLFNASEVLDAPFTEMGELIVQPWIEPSLEYVNNNPYYSGLHLYSLDGALIAGHVSTGAAPTNIAEKSKLGWLSSLGNRRAIKRNDLSKEQWGALQDYVSLASQALSTDWEHFL